MAHSYAYLCRKAGLPEPGPTERHTSRPYRHTRSLARDKQLLRHELDKLVAAGELIKTPEGIYRQP